MPKKPQPYWQYDPIRHELKQVDIKHIAYLYDLNISNVYKCVTANRMIRGFNVFIYNHKPTVKDKRIANEKLKLDDEFWRYYQPLNLYVSNYGRFKHYYKGQWRFKSASNDKNTLYLRFKHKGNYRATDIVYLTFVGQLEEGYHAFPKNHIYNDLYYTNLKALTVKHTHYDNQNRCRPVVMLNDDGDIQYEYPSVLSASQHHYCSNYAILWRCKYRKTIDGLTHMYKDEYEEMKNA